MIKPTITHRFACFFGILSLLMANSFASTYYVANSGSDLNEGSMENPWNSVSFAVSKLLSGDTLYLREGVYFEKAFYLNGLSGILISAYQGEDVEISGGLQDFRSSPNTKWEIYDGEINLYRSIDAYPSSEYMNAWLLDNDLHLIEYELMDNLKSTNYGPVEGMKPIYQGPGILLSSDQHLYIRLENNPNDLVDPLGNSLPPIPSELDPNRHSISVFFTKTLITVSNSSKIKFKDITLSHAQYIFDVKDNTSAFEFDHCRFDYGRYGFVLRGTTIPAASDFSIHHCEFNNGLPDNVYWCDIKNRDSEVSEGYPEFQSVAIDGAMPGFLISHNLFRDSFDALSVKEGTENTKIISNAFIRLRDDAVTFRLVMNVEVAFNIMWKVGEGVSNEFTSATQTDGDLYVHHNIIDASHYQHGGREGNYRASNWPVWQIIDAFGSHGDPYPAKWKVYNNTTVHRRSGYNYNPAELPGKIQSNPELYVYNNIFFILDDRICFRGRVASSGAHYDGNVMYRLLDDTYHQPQVNSFPLFYQFGNGSDFATLATFRLNSGTSWESQGLEVDPEMDIYNIVNGSYEGSEIWKRYFPRNNEVMTQGVSYEGLNWPGTEGVYYRGAMADSMTTGIVGGFLKNKNLPDKFEVLQNYPNPFNSMTTIEFRIFKEGHYSVNIYNMFGEKVADLFDRIVTTGSYTVQLDAGTLPSGMYIYMISGNGQSISKKMFLTK